MDKSYENLISESNKPNADLGKIGNLLPDLLAMPFNGPNAMKYQNVLEIACFWAAHSRDAAAFERYFNQLASLFYFAVEGPVKSADEDTKKWNLMGLQLLNLLVTGRLSEFHVLLERIPEPILTLNQFVIFPVQIEQSLIEGTYHRIIASRNAVPAPEYVWFIDGLVETIRNELASCMEAAFDKLSINQANLFLMASSNEGNLLTVFAQMRGWSVENDLVYFPRPEVEQAVGISPKTWISRSLLYARHVEQII